MGFLKFLKRDKSKYLDMDFDNFDVPPMPPKPPGMEEKGFESLPELPDFDEPAPGMEENKKPISEIKIPLQQTIRVKEAVLQQPVNFNPIEDMQTDFEMQRPEEPMPQIKEDIPEMEPKHRRASPYERFSRAAVMEERSILEYKDSKGPIFMRVDKFRNVLRSISEIRGSLKVSNEILSKLNEIDANAEKDFEKWKDVMTDLQKKLVFVDKTLFKGDKK